MVRTELSINYVQDKIQNYYFGINSELKNKLKTL